MRAVLTNLLPPERQRALARTYRLRFIVVAIWFVSALAFIAIILLIPTFIFLSDSASAKKNTLATIESNLSSGEEKQLAARVAELEAAVATLTDLSHASSVSETLRSVLGVAHPGIMLTSFSYVPAATKTPRMLSITGTASTRESLRIYQLALQAAPFARQAALPVSAYAKDSDIPFTIAITLSP